MNSNQLLTKFSHAINWNAFFYFIHKLFSFYLSLSLFKYLSGPEFSLWANINSILFLMLLWIDFGFRKSLPRYCPAFSFDRPQHRRFLGSIMVFQCTALIIAMPLFIYLIQSVATFLALSLARSALIIIGLVFFTEGIIAITRLIYHSHFWHKEFTIFSSLILTAETLLVLTIMQRYPSYYILTILFSVKIVSNCVIIYLCFRTGKDLLNTSSTLPLDTTPRLHQDFIKHSSIMWFNTAIKSLSERNFMIPFLTYTVGSSHANLFKIANEASLFLYRTITRSIGTTDTSLLTYAQTSPEPSLFHQALNNLHRKLLILCIPALTIGIFCITSSKTVFTEQSIAYLFAILTMSYLIEALLSPFERILEINNNYTTLFIAYIPYILCLLIIYIFNLTSIIGLIGLVACIQACRLLGSFLMAYFAYKKHNATLPLNTLKTVSLLAPSMYLIMYSAIHYTQLGIYIANKIYKIII